jgi:uroporphyrinogen decarboxylase
VDEMVETEVEFILGLTERARREVSFDYVSFLEDFGGKGDPLISPDLFRRFLLAGYRRIIAELRKAGIEHIWLASGGDPRPLIPLMLEAGVTGLSPLEVASGMDAVALRRQYGRNLALAGGIDERELAKSREHIEGELMARIPPLLDRGGYIPHLDHTIPPEVSYDNFRYYLDLKMKLLGY